MIERHKKISETIFAGIFFIVQIVATACNGSSNSDSASLPVMSQRPYVDSNTQSSVATLTDISQDSDPSISASIVEKKLALPKDLIGRWYSLEDQNWLTLTKDQIIREIKSDFVSDIVFKLIETHEKEFVFTKVSNANCVSCASHSDRIKLLVVDHLLVRLVYDDNGEVVENLVRYGVDNASLSGKLMDPGANKRSSPSFFLSDPSEYRIKIQNSHDHSDTKAAEIAADGSFKVSELKSGIYDISLLEGSSDEGLFIIPKIQVIGTEDNIGIISVSNSNYNFKSEFTPLSDFSFDGESYKAKFRVTNIGDESVKGVNYQLSSADPAVQMGTNKSGILNTIDPGKSVEVEVTYTVSGMDFVEEKRVAISITLGDVRGVKWNDVAYLDIYKVKANVNISTLTSVSGVLVFKERKLIPFTVTNNYLGSTSIVFPYLISYPYKIDLSAATRAQEAVYSIDINAANASYQDLRDFFDTASCEPNDLESQATKLNLFDSIVSYLHVGDLDGFTFTLSPITVRYHGVDFPDGRVPSDPSNYLPGQSYRVLGNSYEQSRIGHSFMGWITTDDGRGVVYWPGTNSNVGWKNVDLHARWAVNNYQVTYNGNGNNSGTVPSSATYAYQSTVTVAGNSGALARTGYTFAGWNTAADGSGTTYQAGTGTFSIGAANVTLYARWTSNSYGVTYDGNGNTSGTVPASGNYDYNSTVRVAANSGGLTRTGYTFAGWNTAANGTGTSYSAGTGTFTMSSANLTLYALWTINRYNVTYNSNGNTSGTVPSSVNYNYNATVTVASNSGSLSRAGYSFAGWNTAANGSGVTYAAGNGTFKMGTDNVTLYARWTLNNYSVTYNGNGNSSGTVPSSAYYVYNNPVTVAGNSGTLDRTGYTFSGWNTAADGSGTTYEAGTGNFTMGSANLTLYALWRRMNNYILTYDGNGSTGGTLPSSAAYNYNAPVTVASNVGLLSRTGYLFAGWNTQADGRGTLYIAGTGSFTMGASNTTLFAHWDIICGASGDGCYDYQLTNGVTARTPSGKSLVLANGVWVENGGTRVLAVDGSDNWQMQLWTTTPLNKANVAGRACPTNVYVSNGNMLATGRCLYYDGGNVAQRLDATANDGSTNQITAGEYRLGRWNTSAGGNHGSASWYEGNIQTCAVKGMRLPALYETTAAAPSSQILTYYTPRDAAPTGWGNGVPGVGSSMTWTASGSPDYYSFWLDPIYYYVWSGSSTGSDSYNRSFAVRCVVQ